MTNSSRSKKKSRRRGGKNRGRQQSNRDTSNDGTVTEEKNDSNSKNGSEGSGPLDIGKALTGMIDKFRVALDRELKVYGKQYSERQNRYCVHVSYSGAYFLREMRTIDHMLVSELHVPAKGSRSMFVRNINGLPTFFSPTECNYEAYLSGPTMFGARDLTGCLPRRLYRCAPLTSTSGRLGLMDREEQTAVPSYFHSHMQRLHDQWEHRAPSEIKDAHILRALAKCMIVDGTKYHGFKHCGDFEDFLRRSMSTQNSYWARFQCDFFHLINFMTSNSSELYPEFMGFDKVKTINGISIYRDSGLYVAAGNTAYERDIANGKTISEAKATAGAFQARKFPYHAAIRRITKYITDAIKGIGTHLPCIHSPGLMFHYFFNDLSLMGEPITAGTNHLSYYYTSQY